MFYANKRSYSYSCLSSFHAIRMSDHLIPNNIILLSNMHVPSMTMSDERIYKLWKIAIGVKHIVVSSLFGLKQ